MPDSPLERAAGGPYDRGMEQRVTRLEEAMRDNTAAIGRIDVAVAEIRAVLPSLAGKTEVAQLATRAELGQQVAPLATKAELTQQISQLATKAELTQQISPLATKAELAQQISQLATKAELAQQISQLATRAELAQQISLLATKEELAQQISLLATKEELAQLSLSVAEMNAKIDTQTDTMHRYLATKEDIAELRGYVKGLPTTWVMVTAIVAGQVGITGVIAGALLAAARMFVHS